MNSYKIMSSERGMTLVVALLILAALTLLGTAAIFATATDLKISSNFRTAGETFYAAEAGAEYGVNRLRAALKIIGGDTSSVIPPTINGFTFENAGAFLATNGVTTQTVLPSASAFAGLTSFSKRYTITSTVLKNNTNSRTTLIYELEDQLIPLFQFGIFYDGRLELQPGADMTFTRGRIHSNGDIYLQTSASLKIDTRVTAAGNIYNKRGDTGVVTGNDTVKIKGADGSYHGLNFGSNSSNWKSNATSTWGGTVQSRDHGITDINLPLSTSSDPIDILGTTDDSSLYKQSGLRIMNGVAYDKNGNVLDLTGGGAYPNPITIRDNYIQDNREETKMDVVEVDVQKLQNNPIANAALNNPPTGSDPGILYVSSNNKNDPAVLLTNGSTLNAGLSVATNNPVYIKGDFNTATYTDSTDGLKYVQHPAAIYSDAVTVLSNSWAGVPNSTASATTVNAAIMTGNVPTSGSNYSGGVENFIRFLENWSGKTFTYGGSLTCLWQSRQATGRWGKSNVYSPPNRNWSYNLSVNNLPPGTPRVRNLERVGWRQVTN